MIQKRPVCLIYNRYDRASVTDLLTRATLQPVTTRNRHSRLNFLNQIIMGHVKVDAYSVIPFTSSQSTRQRHERIFTSYQTRNNYFKYFFTRMVNDRNLLTNGQVSQLRWQLLLQICAYKPNFYLYLRILMNTYV